MIFIGVATRECYVFHVLNYDDEDMGIIFATVMTLQFIARVATELYLELIPIKLQDLVEDQDPMED